MGNCTAKSKKRSDQEEDNVDVKTQKKPQNVKSENNNNAYNNLTAGPEIFVSLKDKPINEEYKFGETLGEGAFGSVRIVKHKNTQLLRAMKTIKKSAIINDGEKEKMFSEVTILKEIDHPNIIKLYELYQDTQSYFLLTELCQGGELFDKIKSMTLFDERKAADYMKQILSAIAYCHERDIVHRDLKPENLLFEQKKENANLKVIDFGTSRKMGNDKKLSKRLGTPYYIAPEVLKRNYDEKCDIWSCGVILYILLCGYPPFNGNDEQSILKAVEAGSYTLDEAEWKDVSSDAKDLLKHMLELDPKKRYTAQQAYEHRWIQSKASKGTLSPKVLQNLGSFQGKNKLRQSIMTFIATHIVSQSEKEELLKTFKQLDKDGNGQLSEEELIEGYMVIVKDKEKTLELVQNIFKEVDTNNSGSVDFSEFVVAALNKEKLLSYKKVEQAFKMFDQDNNGYIDRDELQVIMGGIYIDEETWKNILDECDENGDGKIQQNEFIKLLIKKFDQDGQLKV